MLAPAARRTGPARALIGLYTALGGSRRFPTTQRTPSAWGSGSCMSARQDRRRRLWLINAFAVVLLTLLGAAGEQLGYESAPPDGYQQRCSRSGKTCLRLMPNMTDFLLLPLIIEAVRPDASSPTPLRTNVRCHLRTGGLACVEVSRQFELFSRHRRFLMVTLSICNEAIRPDEEQEVARLCMGRRVLSEIVLCTQLRREQPAHVGPDFEGMDTP